MRKPRVLQRRKRISRVRVAGLKKQRKVETICSFYDCFEVFTDKFVTKHLPAKLQRIYDPAFYRHY